MQPETAFIIPYFGKLPPYFSAFIKTVADKNFDIFFFTDIKQPHGLPGNIKWQNKSFEEIKELIETKLNHPVVLEGHYKLCDFKPAYGLIFIDYLKEYIFWGYMDIDICMGDFNRYLHPDKLKKFDVYSGIREYVSGSFFMLRNTSYFNNLFKKSKDWEKVCLSRNYICFDECGGRYFKQLKEGKTFNDIKPAIESFTEVLFKEAPENTRLNFTSNIAEPTTGITTVYKNAVFYSQREFLLVHFIYYKIWYFFYTNKKVRFPFYISRFGFFQNKPKFFNLLVSKNLLFAVQKKIRINLKKLKLDV